jgi:hypothetical protein
MMEALSYQAEGFDLVLLPQVHDPVSRFVDTVDKRTVRSDTGSLIHALASSFFVLKTSALNTKRNENIVSTMLFLFPDRGCWLTVNSILGHRNQS